MVVATPYRLHSSIVDAETVGVTTNLAPARIATRAVSASRTLPAPISAREPSVALAAAMASPAAGLVKVNSTARTPPATSASVSGTALERSSRRTTAMTPSCSMSAGDRVMGDSSVRQAGRGPIEIPLHEGGHAVVTRAVRTLGRLVNLDRISAEDRDHEGLGDIAFLQEALLQRPLRVGAGEAVRLQLPVDRQLWLDAENDLHVVTPLVGQHRDPGVIADRRLDILPQRDGVIDGVIHRAVGRGVVVRTKLATTRLNDVSDRNHPGRVVVVTLIRELPGPERVDVGEDRLREVVRGETWHRERLVLVVDDLFFDDAFALVLEAWLDTGNWHGDHLARCGRGRRSDTHEKHEDNERLNSTARHSRFPPAGTGTAGDRALCFAQTVRYEEPGRRNRPGHPKGAPFKDHDAFECITVPPVSCSF